MRTTTIAFRVIVALISLVMLSVSFSLYSVGNNFAATSVMAILGAIIIESVAFERGSYQATNKIK
jgi:hypothetical protein